tara:strand:+ start:468 stop:1031 length:564 start_codon:yes stop_codon:yes gene_type:complete
MSDIIIAAEQAPEAADEAANDPQEVPDQKVVEEAAAKQAAADPPATRRCIMNLLKGTQCTMYAVDGGDLCRRHHNLKNKKKTPTDDGGAPDGATDGATDAKKPRGVTNAELKTMLLQVVAENSELKPMLLQVVGENAELKTMLLQVVGENAELKASIKKLVKKKELIEMLGPLLKAAQPPAGNHIDV